MPKPDKIEAVAEMKKLFEAAGSFFVTDYQGLNVADMTVLRKNLRQNNVKYLIAKNTLLKLAAREAGVSDIDEHFIGPTAVAFSSDDPAMAAKILNDSFKARELPRMKVFVVDNQVYEGAEIKRLADLPPRDILLSQLVAAVESPFSSLVGSLDGFFRELVGTIEALADKKKSEG
ncbi:MAG: 50S ribosomal protein L10 [Candidatus Zixiibacteriota bacterium]|nr:MAG: 50S ribosomal protein L10 [candidate division Zixibacteria bacterium]